MVSTELLQHFHAIGPSLWMPSEKTLILADVHLGFEESLHQQGVLVPKRQLAELLALLEGILSNVHPETIILAGDTKHVFGKILRQEWNDAEKVFVLLKKNCQELVLVKGNHDTIIEPLAKRFGAVIVKEFFVGEDRTILILHGDKIPETIPNTVKTIIIGHAHPAIRIRSATRSELYKCFLVGSWKRKQLIVLPSTNPLLEGSDVLQERTLSPFLKKVDDFEVYAIDENTVLPFGKVKGLRV
mgnify:FL=1